MLETSARLLRLLALFQARRYWSGAELSERLAVTPRTLRRDVGRLRSLGYPVHSSAGTAGGYQLGQGATLPPLLLDDDEAVAVAIGLRTAASGSVSGIEEVSLRALTKLEQVLPSRLARRVAALHAVIVPLPSAGPVVDAASLSAIAGACRDCAGLRFRYLDHSRKPSERAVEPLQLVHTGRRWYLVAWDLGREDWRTFRVDRIQPPLSSGRRFTPRPPPGKDIAEYVSRSLSSAPYTFRAVILLRAPLGEVSARIPPAAGTLQAIDEGSCLLETGAHTLDSLSMHLAMLGIDFEVREPPELVERLRVLAARLTRASA